MVFFAVSVFLVVFRTFLRRKRGGVPFLGHCPFGIYHTSSIRYFQMRYPRYPRVPWYGIPRVFTGVTPVNTQHDALPPVCFPTEDKRPEVIRAGDVQFSKMYQTSRRFFTPVNTQHDALPPVCFPTEDKRPEVIRAGTSSFQMYQNSR